MPPKISVLVPNYNYGRFLPEAIESILAQDYPDFELLICDNVSTDDSREVIERYAGRDERIRYRINETNIGGVPNWNLCLELARGEYVKYLFSDDRLADTGALGKMAAVLDRNPDVTLVTCAARIVERDTSERRIRDAFGESFVCGGAAIAVLCLTRNGNFLGEPSAAMFRRVSAGRGFPLDHPYVADLEMWIHLLERGGFGYIAEPLCDFRDHPDRPATTHVVGGGIKSDYARLLLEYIDRPWFRDRMTPRAMFYALHSYRRRHGEKPDTTGLDERLLGDLGRSRYALCWLRHRVEHLLLPRSTRRARRIPLQTPRKSAKASTT